MCFLRCFLRCFCFCVYSLANRGEEENPSDRALRCPEGGGGGFSQDKECVLKLSWPSKKIEGSSSECTGVLVGEDGERGERREASSDGNTEEEADVGGTRPRGSLMQTPPVSRQGKPARWAGRGPHLERIAMEEGRSGEGRKELTEYSTYPKNNPTLLPPEGAVGQP